MNLIRTELLKQRTTRPFLAAAAAVPVVAATITFAICSLSGKHDNDPLGPDSLLHAIGGPTAVITLIALMLGVVGMAGAPAPDDHDHLPRHPPPA